MKFQHILAFTGLGLSLNACGYDEGQKETQRPSTYQDRLTERYLPAVSTISIRMDSVLKDTAAPPARKLAGVRQIYNQEARKFAMAHDSVELNMDEKLYFAEDSVLQLQDICLYTQTKHGESAKFSVLQPAH